MKTLVVIWAAALLSGIGTVGYISNGINQLVVKQHECVVQCPNVDVQPAEANLQGSSVQLQNVPSDELELQPALGYKALNWQVDNLRVQ